MIFLYTRLLCFQSRHPAGSIKLPVTIIHLIMISVILSCQIVHSVLFLVYILPFNIIFVNKYFVFLFIFLILSVNFTNTSQTLPERDMPLLTSSASISKIK